MTVTRCAGSHSEQRRPRRPSPPSSQGGPFSRTRTRGGARRWVDHRRRTTALMNGEPPTAGRTIGSGVRLLADPERGSAPPEIIWLILGQHIPCLAGPARRCPGRRQRQQPLRPVHLRTASKSARGGSELNNAAGSPSFRWGSCFATLSRAERLAPPAPNSSSPNEPATRGAGTECPAAIAVDAVCANSPPDPHPSTEMAAGDSRCRRGSLTLEAWQLRRGMPL
jgi:hypothetical protein